MNLDFPKEKLGVIIVDGLSTDDTLPIAKAILSRSGLRWEIVSDGGRGLGFARQFLISRAHTKFIAFVDADQTLYPSWLKKTISFLLSHPEVAGTRGVQGLTRGLPISAALENYIKHVEDTENLSEASPAKFAIGGSLFRAEAITEADGFDSCFASSAEDTDLAFKILKNGWKITNLKGAVFYHSPRTSWRSLYRQYNIWGRSSQFVIEKHRDSFEKFYGVKVVMDFLSQSILSVRYVIKVFDASRDLRSSFLPIHSAYKRAAFMLGYFSGMSVPAKKNLTCSVAD